MRKIHKGAICFLTALCLLSATAACRTGEGAGEEPPAPEEAPVEESYDFSVFLGEHFSEADTAAMVEDCEDENGLRVKVLPGGEGEAGGLLEDDEAPLVLAIGAGGELDELLRDGLLMDLSAAESLEMRVRIAEVPEALRAAGGGEHAVPGGLRAWGLAFDEAVIAGFFGEDEAKRFAEDCGGASWAEWTALVEAMDRYLRAPAPETVFLNGRPYAFLAEKTAVSEHVTGVFAIAGAEPGIWGEGLMNAALSRAFVTPGALSARFADFASGAAGPPEAPREAFAAYAEAVDLYTSHLAGLYSAGVRGEDFVTAVNYGRSKVYRMFMEGRAVFLPCDSGVLATLRGMDAAKASRLEMLPLKLPGEDMDLAGRFAFINSALPMEASWYYCVSAAAAADPELSAQAARFLLWLEDWTAETAEGMDASLLAYERAGNIYGLPVGAAPSELRRAALSSDGLRPWLQREFWTAEDRESLADYLSETWNFEVSDV
jgi:raffinose/stachyose/melibiose transport system substrate-binding protein